MRQNANSIETESSHSDNADITILDNESEISLKDIFPNDSRNLDDLFPEPEIRSLFNAITENIKDLDKFKLRIKNQMDSDNKRNLIKRPLKSYTLNCE